MPNSIGIVDIVLVVVSVLFWLQTFLVLYHLIRFGIGRAPKQLALFSMSGSVIIFIGVIVAYFSLN